MAPARNIVVHIPKRSERAAKVQRRKKLRRDIMKIRKWPLKKALVVIACCVPNAKFEKPRVFRRRSIVSLVRSCGRSFRKVTRERTNGRSAGKIVACRPANQRCSMLSLISGSLMRRGKGWRRPSFLPSSPRAIRLCGACGAGGEAQAWTAGAGATGSAEPADGWLLHGGN